MEELRLLDNHLGPLDFHSRTDTSVDSACSLAAAPGPALQRRDVGQPVASLYRHLYGGEAELSHLPREPSRVFALVSDPGPASPPCQ